MKKNKKSGVNDAPVTQDALNTYLKKISKIPLLKREEEGELARRIQKGDQDALNELVNRNLRYVVSVANKYKGCGLSLGDLISEGNVGLIQAAKRFDPERGVKFITYAVWWIRQAIMHALAEQSGTVRLPIKQAGLLYKIGEKYQQLMQKKGREPTTQDLAKELGLAPEDIESVLRVYRTHLSLDSPIKDNDETSYIELLDAGTPAVEENLLRSSLSQEIDEILEELTPREREILKLRYGFDGEPMTLEEIGNKLKLSRERIRQIEKKAKNKLRTRSRTKTLRDYLN
jgi:RNA polymerase primary sigma factor